MITETQAAFCLSCVLMAALAVFETLRHWLPYTDIAVRWSGNSGYGFYRARVGLVRALVSSGNPSALAFMLATACGFWLYLQSHVDPHLRRLRCPAALAGSSGHILERTVARRRSHLRRRWRAQDAHVIQIVQSCRWRTTPSRSTCLTPLGERIVALLPLSIGLPGDEASGSITYRQRLLERSWDLFTQHPFLGDQLALLKLNDMRQGEGIIDMANT